MTKHVSQLIEDATYLDIDHVAVSVKWKSGYINMEAKKPHKPIEESNGEIVRDNHDT